MALRYILIVEDNEDDFEATERSFRNAHFANPISWARSAPTVAPTFASSSRAGTTASTVGPPSTGPSKGPRNRAHFPVERRKC